MKNNYHLQSRMGEKRHYFGIRRLKVGVASVVIASGFLLGNAQLVQADEASTATSPATEAVSDANAAAQPKSADEEKTGEAGSSGAGATEHAAPTGVVADQAPASAVSEAAGQEAANPSEKDKQEPVSQPQASAKDAIEEGNIRFHFKTLPSQNLDSLGLWTWDDVETPSSQKGGWPTGATSFATAKEDDYGYYLDVKMAEKRSKISLLINNTAGQNITGDKTVELLSPQMNEVWFDTDYQPHTYEPLKKGMVRINYYRTDGQYDKKSLWLWGDVQNPSKNWPDGVDFEKTGKYGRYVDVPLKDAAKMIGFLLLDESKSGDDVKIQNQDYNFANLEKNSQIFLRDADPTVYTNPYFVNDIRMIGAQHIGLTEIEASFSTLESAKKEDILKNLKITAKDGNEVAVKDVVLDPKTKSAKFIGDFNQAQSPYLIKYGNDQFKTSMNWQLKDSIYKYDGDLGARVSQAGKQVDLTFWSPSADQVDLVVYDKEEQNKVIGRLAMQKGESGTWTSSLTPESGLGISDYRGYFYHYEITRGGKKVLVLDPYAKSLAAWNSEDADKGDAYKIAKAAFVDPSEYGPKDLTMPIFRTLRSGKMP